jgi:hypothetical protein
VLAHAREMLQPGGGTANPGTGIKTGG